MPSVDRGERLPRVCDDESGLSVRLRSSLDPVALVALRAQVDVELVERNPVRDDPARARASAPDLEATRVGAVKECRESHARLRAVIGRGGAYDWVRVQSESVSAELGRPRLARRDDPCVEAHEVAELVRSHHERADGLGFPTGAAPSVDDLAAWALIAAQGIVAHAVREKIDRDTARAAWLTMHGPHVLPAGILDRLGGGSR